MWVWVYVGVCLCRGVCVCVCGWVCVCACVWCVIACMCAYVHAYVRVCVKAEGIYTSLVYTCTSLVYEGTA